MDKLLVISSYPPRGEIHYKKTVGIASYTKNTLMGIKKNSPNLGILVLAEKLDGEINSYEDEGIGVSRVWKRGSFLTFPELFSIILKSKTKHLLFEFEVSMFGSIIHTAPLPFFILLLRMFGKKVTIVLHQAITNLSDFEGHTNIKGTKSSLLSFAINVFYFLLIRFCNKTIVFEEALKEKLPESNKINIIPHGVQNFKDKPSKSDARKRLNIPEEKIVMVVFGFIAWYKGTDWIVEEFSKAKKQGKLQNAMLIIAGGPNPNHNKKRFYMDYVNKVIQAKNNQIMVTGFVEESKIADFYQAADAIVLPYRAFMSASGPLSLSYSFGKPAFISSALTPILKTLDITEIMDKLGLVVADISFSLDENSLEKLVDKLMDKEKLGRIEELSDQLARERTFEKIGKKYTQAIFN